MEMKRDEMWQTRFYYDVDILEGRVDHKILEEVHGLVDTKIGPNQNSLDAFSRIAIQCVVGETTMTFVIRELEKALHFQLQSEDQNFERLKIRLKDIKLATENFAKKKLIGSGAYGEVYEAELNIFGPKSSVPQERKNSVVAIKRILSRDDEQGNEGFLAELKVLARCQPPNIVSLLGFCVDGPRKILIYERAENGSLDNYLGCTETQICLTWSQRIKLCLDIAYGLNYLHTATEDKNKIIHCDIKSANILLDKNWQAKIADFGLSRFHPTDQLASTIITKHIVGTEVYLDPEYYTTGNLKQESDIYSLGVVLFEILSGRLAYDSIYLMQDKNGLAPIARQHFKEGTLKKMIDPKIMEEAHELSFTRKIGPNPHSLNTFSRIAYRCVVETQVMRPKLISVIEELEKAFHRQEYRNDILKISLEDIKLATENFSDNNCIATGVYGNVYNGDIQYDTGSKPVHVKRFNKSSQEHNFLTELEVIFRHKHENVIGLVGYCKVMDEKITVYEHMSKGSLDMHLNKVGLRWIERLKICIDVANGLNFLHECDQKEDVVIHRDIKSSSILLNGDWKAKISDFEQSLITPRDKMMDYVIKDVLGTPGYCEYPLNWEMGFLSKESDIFSFGVVLFEVLSGRLTMENYNATGQFLDTSVIDCFEQGKLDEIVFSGIKEQIAPQSLTTFQQIAYRCLHHKRQKRPTIREVVVQLKKALEIQEDHDIWEPKLPADYKNIFQSSKSPEVYATKRIKDLYDMLSKGILLQDGKVWFSFRGTAERTELVSAINFSYINRSTRKWRSIQESRFKKVAKMLDIMNLKIKIKTRAQFLSPDVVYGMYLVFKFCDSRKISSKPTYVNLQYKKGGESETLHAYFSTRRDEEWMMIELFRFSSHKEHTTFEFLLQSISPYYCGDEAIYVEGIEFRDIEKVKPEESKKLKEVSHALQFNSNESKFQRSETNDELFWLNEVNGKKHLMISAKKALYDLSNEKLFTSKPSAEFSLLSELMYVNIHGCRFEEVVELRPQQVFRINCKFERQKLTPDTDYSCYLVFRLLDKCRGLHCPVKVRNLLHRRNKEAGIIYFRSPSPWNLHDNNHVPEQREDGWMEVKVWKLDSDHELKKDHINVNLKLISYEGTMAGLIVCGLEFRPM